MAFVIYRRKLGENTFCAIVTKTHTGTVLGTVLGRYSRIEQKCYIDYANETRASQMYCEPRK